MNFKKNVIKNLNKLIVDSIINEKEKALEILKENNINTDNLVKVNLEFIKKLRIKTEISLNKNERGKKKLLELAIGKLRELKERGINNPKKTLKTLLENIGDENLSLQFRKLENMSDEEALEILDETQLLELLNSLDKK